MASVSDVYGFLDKIAPVEMKMDFDNVGFLLGCAETEVTKIIVALDISNDVISEAAEYGAELIVSHHPMFFSLKRITDSDITGKKIIRMLTAGQSAICMHTNLDAARGGVNDALAKAAGISGKEEAALLTEGAKLSTGEAFSYGRVGCLQSPCSMQEYLKMLKKSLGTNGLRYYDSGREVFKVAVVGGSGGDEFQNALKAGCDTFVTADIKYHLFLEAKELGINLIDGDHFCTENLVTKILAEQLNAAFPNIQTSVSKSLTQPVKFY